MIIDLIFCWAYMFDIYFVCLNHPYINKRSHHIMIATIKRRIKAITTYHIKMMITIHRTKTTIRTPKKLNENLNKVEEEK